MNTITLFLTSTVAQIDIDSLISAITGGQVTPLGDNPTFEMFQAYVATIVTFIFGWIRNLFPKMRSIPIPRAVTVVISGLTIVSFVFIVRPEDPNWLSIIVGTVSTPFIYDAISGFIDELEGKNAVAAAILKFIFQGKTKGLMMVKPSPPSDPAGEDIVGVINKELSSTKSDQIAALEKQIAQLKG